MDQLIALANAANGNPPPEKTSAPEPPPELCDDPELIQDFLAESREHLGSVEQRLLELEQNPSNSEAIHATFRSFHTIKGLAGFLGFGAVQHAAHDTETLLDLARSGTLSVTPPLIDVILRSADYLKGILNRIEAKDSAIEKAPPPKLTAALLAAVRPASASPEPADLAASVDPPADEGSSAKTSPDKAATSLKVDAEKIEYLIDMVGELAIAQSIIRQNPSLSEITDPVVIRSLAQLSRVTAEVQKTAMSMRMAPVNALFQKMSRVIRDVARKSGKKVILAVTGEEAEMDRKILDGLAEPLMHMVRNAVDHGLEGPEDRIRAGKSETGTIHLRAERESGNLVIEISDNGRGLNAEKIRQKALERGLITADSKIQDEDIFRLIFEPGFSTAEKLTEFSGRGVGMDVVRRQVESLREEWKSVQPQARVLHLPCASL